MIIPPFTFHSYRRSWSGFHYNYSFWSSLHLSTEETKGLELTWFIWLDFWRDFNYSGKISIILKKGTNMKIHNVFLSVLLAGLQFLVGVK